MNDYILIGKIVNTFGIKGELKIVSNFEFKTRVFVEDFPIYIGVNKSKELISTHRFHKNHDLILFKGYSNINEVLKYKGENIYILKSDLILGENEYLLNDLVGYQVYDEDSLLGVIISYEETPSNVLFKVRGEKTFYLPFIEEYIKEVDKENKKILTNRGSELVL